ncbi:Trehalose utilization [Aquisphaera giovannonii]|uniref:Trehalose utilization n=1 Tax=Aquisphaera giovannonii TaxID=406548 RepID=A0A5B9WD92_9BACT|nr:sialate O-acetylesterase [Aquisphaera giovannonii]QEH38487.1 Trehalose utilization [Aquisphaera giovannonii]
MAGSLPLRPRPAASRLAPSLVVGLALVGLCLVPSGGPIRAQVSGPGGPAGAMSKMAGRRPTAVDERIKSPRAMQVFQRDANNRATIPIAFEDPDGGATVVSATVLGGGMGAPGFNNAAAGDRTRFEDGKLVGVPTGGPYTIRLQVKRGNNQEFATVGPVFVGDLWVLAGQSNMEGVGDLVDVTPPHASVMALGMDGKWAQAEEPLHWLVDSPDPVHSGDPATRANRSAEQHRTRAKGAGLGLPFAVAMVEATRVPVGLVATAHGGTSMAQWDPAKKGEGGNSLYGSFLRQVQLAGGKVKGVLWYQGESDANPQAAKVYHKVFADFIAAVRSDLNQPDLPFYFVQIGRFIIPGSPDPKDWNLVQDAQRRLPDRVPNTAVISVVDLELDDLIHVGTQGLKRAGQRLARIALREQFGQVGATTPTFDRVAAGSHNTLLVKFKGVNVQPNAAMNRRGMGGMMGGPAGMGGMGMGGMGMGGMGMGGGSSPGEDAGAGLRPERHVGGFSIRKEDGTAIPLIFEAKVGKSNDSVVLKLTGAIPPHSFLWYGYGHDPYCNLVDGLDMAVPVFGPIGLDNLGSEAEAAAAPAASPTPAPAPVAAGAPKPSSAAAPVASATKPAGQPGAASTAGPIKVLIITGDNYHDWKATTEYLKSKVLTPPNFDVDVTATPAKDLTESNLAKYDVLLLNYMNTNKGGPETQWSDANKQAFLDAVRGGKGLVSYHFASAAFTKPNWAEFEKAIAGGWRSQGFHGPKHVFTVKKAGPKHPISEGLPAEFVHAIDELYQNSVITPGSTVLATAYSDPKKPRGTGKDEPVIWVNTYGKGRVYVNALGHDVEAMSDPNFAAWLRRGVVWAATGEVPPGPALGVGGGQQGAAKAERRIARAEYIDKMKGGWIGQMAGVAVGGPTEFRYQGETVPADKVPAWKPSMINQYDQDDLYVEMTFLRTLEQHGLGATARQAGIDFANSRYPLWHANKAGRDLLRKGIAPPDSGHPALNSHADDIDYQIEADFSGLIAPGLPNTAIALGETFGRLMNAGDGLYGGQFIGAMYAEAFFEADPEAIVRAGLKAIPQGSQYAEAIRDVLAWYKESPDNWEATWRKVDAKYQKNRDYRRFSCSKDEKEPYKFNIDAKLNGAYLVMGILYGKGDPDRTIVVATRCGQDSDCNPSSAAGVVFTTIGYSKLPRKYVEGLDANTKFNSTPYTFSRLIAVCEDLADQAVKAAGGRIERSADGSQMYVIPVEAPRPSPLASCWEPGPKANSTFSAREKGQIVEKP